MANKVYIGNLSFKATEAELEELFSEFGQIESTKIIKDRETGRSKGFAFIEMATDDEAQNAIDHLDGTMFQNRQLVVNKARPRKERPNRRY